MERKMKLLRVILRTKSRTIAVGACSEHAEPARELSPSNDPGHPVKNGSRRLVASSAGLEEQDSDLTEVEVDEMLGLMGHVGTEVAAHNAMPRGVVLLVELLLDECGDVLFDVELLESLGGNINSVLLHVLGHISVLDYCLSVCHGECCLRWF